jgi:ADP-heptose:LPS heptosyltransferase
MADSLDMNAGRKIDNWLGSVLVSGLFALSRLRAHTGGAAQPTLYETTPPGVVPPPPTPRRVLAIKLYGLGNIAMLLPVLAALRRGLPDAEIDFLTLDENRSLLERSGLVNRALTVRAEGYVGLFRDLWRTFLRMRRQRYDLVLDFEQFIKLSTIISYLTGAPDRIGFNTAGQRRGSLYTTRVVCRDGDHMSDVFMRILRPLRIDMTPSMPDMHTSEEEMSGANALLAEAGVDAQHKLVVAVHIGSGPNFYKLALKRWPTSSFAKLCDMLIERRGAAIVLTGKGEEEAALVEEVKAQMKHAPIDACDRLSIGELLALLKRADLTVSNDTSVMHLASVMGTPVTAFFGPTDPLQYGPRNPHDVVMYRDYYCSPCLTNYNLKISYCTAPVCIRSITPEETYERIDVQLSALGATQLEVLS